MELKDLNYIIWNISTLSCLFFFTSLWVLLLDQIAPYPNLFQLIILSMTALVSSFGFTVLYSKLYYDTFNLKETQSNVKQNKTTNKGEQTKDVKL